MWGSSRSPSGNLSLELRLQRAGRKTGERIRYVAASGELGSACSLGIIGPGSFLALIRGQKRDSKEGGWRRTSERAGEKARSRRKYSTVQTASRRESTAFARNRKAGLVMAWGSGLIRSGLVHLAASLFVPWTWRSTRKAGWSANSMELYSAVWM